MKLISKNPIININHTIERQDLQINLSKVESYIKFMEYPIGSGNFSLYNEKKSNGVKPIKDTFMQKLREEGWVLENKLDVGVTRNRPGPIDATYELNEKHIALEWETGNISSSHRAVNKMVAGLLKGSIICGILVLPSRSMYEYLTDRVGNFRELEPYFPVWSQANYNLTEGAIIIYEIEHDNVSSEVPKIKKGTDGRALR